VKSGLLENAGRADEQAERLLVPQLIHGAGVDQARPVLAREDQPGLDQTMREPLAACAAADEET
jgi:hypothetical protein